VGLFEELRIMSILKLKWQCFMTSATSDTGGDQLNMLKADAQFSD
jgi:hypothetical protein